MRPWLAAELRMVAPTLRVIVCLGGFAWQALWPVLATAATGAEAAPGVRARRRACARRDRTGQSVAASRLLSPEPAEHFTGRVTPDMIDAIFTRARDAAGLPRPPA